MFSLIPNKLKVQLKQIPLQNLDRLDLDGVDVLSFDIFDTLLHRPVAVPEDLHEITGRRIAAEISRLVSPSDWRKERIVAEQRARARVNREIGFEEIMEQLSGKFSLTPRELALAGSIELDTEAGLLAPIAPMQALLQRARREKKRIAFVSDMYIPRERILGSLQQENLYQSEDILLVSSDLRKTKHDGALFGELIRRTGCSPKRILHLGDHPKSDCLVPLRHGLRARHVLTREWTRYEQFAISPSDASLINSVLSGASRVARLSACSSDRHDRVIREVSSGVAGPLLTGFVLWALLEAQRRGLKRLYFLARDGQILTRMAAILAPRFRIDVECSYLYASRQALFLPALDIDDVSAPDILRRMAIGRTLCEFAGSLELDPAEFADAARAAKISIDPIGTKLDVDKLGGLFRLVRQEPFVRAIQHTCFERRKAMLAYFEKEGVFADHQFGIVDVGWKGNLQVFIANAFAVAHMDKKPDVTGLYFGLVEEPPPMAGKTAVFADARKINASLLELFCAADHGTLRAYSAEGLPLKGVDVENREAVEWGLAAQQDTILKFAETFAGALSGGPMRAWDVATRLRDHGLAAFRLLNVEPSFEEAEIYGSFPHACDAAHEYFRELAPRKSLPAAIWSRLRSQNRDDWFNAVLVRSTRSNVLARICTRCFVIAGTARRLLQSLKAARI